jgi:hypothetical protein
MMGKPEEKRQVGRPRRGWEDNIKMNIREKGWRGMDWIKMVPDRGQWRVVVNTAINLHIP